MSPLHSPTQLIQHVLRCAPLSLRLNLLCRAKEANEKRLKKLTAFRLACIEEGWDDYWLQQHEHTTETLAAINQELTTCLPLTY